MSTLQKVLQGRRMRGQNVCIFTDWPMIAYPNKHVQQILERNNRNAKLLQNVIDSCRNYGGIISGEQPFLRCKSMFGNRLRVCFERPYNNPKAYQRVLFHGHTSCRIYSNTLILSDNNRTLDNLKMYRAYFLHIKDVHFRNFSF